MICLENQYGKIEISQNYFANLIGKAVSECFGVAGMLSSPVQGLRSAIFRGDRQDKGVHVRMAPAGLVVDLHIAVTYGMNIAAISKSIVNKVRYTVEEATDFGVAKVNVFVDSMKND